MRPGFAGFLALLVFLALGVIANTTSFGVFIASLVAPYSAILLFLALGGLVGVSVALGLEQVMPGFILDVIDSARTGFLLLLVGADGKVRLMPGVSDGHFITPSRKPYKEKYVFAADGQSVMPIHKGKGVRAVLAYMKYPFTLDPRMTAAISVFRQRFKTIDDLFAAAKAWEELERLGGRGAAEKQLAELQGELDALMNMSVEELKQRRIEDPEKAAAELRGAIDYLERVLKLAPRSREELEAKLGGVTIKASDLIDYLVWRHHPADLKKIINAEQASLMEKVKEDWMRDWVKKWLPIIVIIGLVVMGVLGVIYMGMHGGGAPHAPGLPRTISVGGG